MTTEEATTIPDEGTDYKKQYETVLKAADKTTRTLETVQAQLSAEKQAHEATRASIENMKSEVTTLNSTITQKESALVELGTKVTTLESFQTKATRLEVLMNEFPQLAPFEKEGLLPQGKTADELRTSFTKFSEKLSTLSKANAVEQVAGGKPANLPAPEEPKGSVDLAKQFLDAAVQAQRVGNFTEYDLNFGKFLQERNKT